METNTFIPQEKPAKPLLQYRSHLDRVYRCTRPMRSKRYRTRRASSGVRYPDPAAGTRPTAAALAHGHYLSGVNDTTPGCGRWGPGRQAQTSAPPPPPPKPRGRDTRLATRRPYQCESSVFQTTTETLQNFDVNPYCTVRRRAIFALIYMRYFPI